MRILVTGAAGFIGAHVVQRLAREGHTVVGIDNMSPYYSPAYKRERIRRLWEGLAVDFREVDITDPETMEETLSDISATHVCHLAAQAGVRYSLTKPYLYEKVNVGGTLAMLEWARRKGVSAFIFASTSSVYGANEKLPFSEDDRVESPVSLYGATKIAAERIAYSYWRMYGIPCVGLRYFTVYGPWGRPDMAYFIFARAMLRGEPIRVFGEGNMQRDFTFIDDIVSGTCAAIQTCTDGFDIINLGNSNRVDLEYFISLLEQELKMTCTKEYLPMQVGDFRANHADITKAREKLGFNPNVSIEEGMRRMGQWLRDYTPLLQETGVL